MGAHPTLLHRTRGQRPRVDTSMPIRTIKTPRKAQRSQRTMGRRYSYDDALALTTRQFPLFFCIHFITVILLNVQWALSVLPMFAVALGLVMSKFLSSFFAVRSTLYFFHPKSCSRISRAASVHHLVVHHVLLTVVLYHCCDIYLYPFNWFPL